MVDKYGPDLLLVKLNEQKVLTWLKAKFDHVVTVLKKYMASESLSLTSNAATFSFSHGSENNVFQVKSYVVLKQWQKEYKNLREMI